MLKEFKGNISSAEDHHHYGQKHGPELVAMSWMLLLLTLYRLFQRLERSHSKALPGRSDSLREANLLQII